MWQNPRLWVRDAEFGHPHRNEAIGRGPVAELASGVGRASAASRCQGVGSGKLGIDQRPVSAFSLWQNVHSPLKFEMK